MPSADFAAPPRPLGARARLRARLARSRWAGRAGIGRPDREGYIRAEALDALDAHAEVDTNVVLRSTFWAGAAYVHDQDARRQARLEYVRNMVESDYVLCVRGAGNFSYRLYETLSCGRIPVFIDTDCVLPFDFVVDWRDYCVWVDESEIDSIAEVVSAFHERLGEAEFTERQRRCRRFWEEYLSPFGFFANLHRHFGQPRAAKPQARRARRLAG
jgi:hypothetical protein